MPLPPAPKRRASRLDAQWLAAQSPAESPVPEKVGTPSITEKSPSKRRKKQDTPATRLVTSAVATSMSQATVTASDVQASGAASVASVPSTASTVSATTATTPARKKRKSRPDGAQPDTTTRLFVLDTNVIMHDPSCLFRFEEHDVYLPLVVLEELDRHKMGANEVARNVRQASRTLDALIATTGNGNAAQLQEGIALTATGNSTSTGKLFFQTSSLESTLPGATLPPSKADNQILGVVAALQQHHTDRAVVLVTKDINMRIKAHALGLSAEDYRSDKTLDDDELLYSGKLELSADCAPVHLRDEGSHTLWRVQGDVVGQMYINQFVYRELPGQDKLYARVVQIQGDSAVIKSLRDCAHPKQAAWGVMARNREQNFAMNLLLDPDVDFVTLTGTAGTGKTLLALACGLTQVLDERRYSEIIMTRATVSVGEDIGFLPGTEEEKMSPWMGALDDNLEFLIKGDGAGAGEWGRAATEELIRSRIRIKSISFMRGRTFLNKFLIIDEAQNLTPKQMNTLITRAGPGTKIFCMGNLAQVDMPYLTEGSSGLTYVVDRFKGWAHGGHITLARGERSRLADFASGVL